MNNKALIRKLVLTGILTAIVVVLQVFSGYIRFGPFSITLALVPIIVGGALCGPLSGAFLGLVFSVVVLINDSAAFLAVDPFGTVLTVLLKGTLAGLASALIFRLLSLGARKQDGKQNPWMKMLRVLIAGIACPIVNTGIFVVGCLLFFMPTLAGWAEALGYKDAASYLFTGMIGINFLVEFATVTLLSPVIVRIIDLAPGSDNRA
ncbi:MAG: ECF transporter S component [Clostridia bacterium]|nr:ECF transporter S component [Clostridia bacterium]MBP5271023.1 ECF transporter S component [Clostridia bacterium]